MIFTALLPMKGNSVRVPNKNLRLIAGKPRFAHVLKSLSECSFVNEIIVNTDSELIANKVLELFPKVKINWRRKDLIGDDVPMNLIIASDLEIASNEYILQTHSTNPLLSTRTLEDAWKKYEENRNKFDSLFSVNKFQSRFFHADFSPINHDPEILLKTQDLPPIYEENSLFYFFNKSGFARTIRRIGKNPILFPTPKIESVDIDTEEDFLLAEKLIATRN